jgi:hypothetical protein
VAAAGAPPRRIPDDHPAIVRPQAAVARCAGHGRCEGRRVSTVRPDDALPVATMSVRYRRFAPYAEAPAGVRLKEADAQAAFEAAEGTPPLRVWQQNGPRDRARRMP